MRAFPTRPPSSFSFREILYGKDGGVARITINRPDRYNAYSTACLEELASALRDAAFDDAVGVIVLTGAGEQLVRNLVALGIERLRTEVAWDEHDLNQFLGRRGFTPAPRLVLELSLDRAPGERSVG